MSFITPLARLTRARWVVSLSTMKLIPHRLTAALSLTGIRSLADVSNLVGPIGHPVAPMHKVSRLSYELRTLTSPSVSHLVLP